MMFFVETEYGSSWKSIRNIQEYLHEMCSHITQYEANEVTCWARNAKRNDIYENKALKIKVKAGIKRL